MQGERKEKTDKIIIPNASIDSGVMKVATEYELLRSNLIHVLVWVDYVYGHGTYFPILL
jgi:hypothetical protein